ncbi:protein SAWADEE HOMEODOMAIN 1-like isoform X2 [Carex littledalei]|uniref:Protein SAWADEE HOMEODOMAIN 1-like isoform X2 n=1 Tax=Carex littledalei TaxID=544730 RepID=A0A833W3F4_9POAL|nr:protein SAWADEE HOMEODOMAIN 1-like isoform X2 [Carex littledalei]
MGKPRKSRAAPFSGCQVEHLEKMISEKKASELLDRNFCQQLARQFKSVQEWFENKLTCLHTQFTHLPSLPVDNENENEIASNTSLSNNDLQEADERDKMPDLDKLEFEARSSRDFAWYDVGTFLAHRISNDQVEVKVRYADFGADEDEWINVKRAIRVRSVPVESCECTKVQVGDLVLCFREGSNEAVHYDAHIVEIERKQHDIRGCRCLFLIRYDHDETEKPKLLYVSVADIVWQIYKPDNLNMHCLQLASLTKCLVYLIKIPMKGRDEKKHIDVTWKTRPNAKRACAGTIILHPNA